jgi:predicted nucleotidyltransferase
VRFCFRKPIEDSLEGVSARVAGSIMKPMSPHVSIDRDAVSAFCQRHHIAQLALFGSVLRDDFGPDSDVDVLVEFEAGHVPGFNFVSIEREFSGLLRGRGVDMVTPKFLNFRIRDQILSSAESLYVAP